MKNLQREFFLQNDKDRNPTAPFLDLRSGEIDTLMLRTAYRTERWRKMRLADIPEEEIKKYYSVAPKIVAAIPKNNPEWDWVGTQIDSAIQDIDNNMLDKAHKTYKNMVLKLETNWLN